MVISGYFRDQDGDSLEYEVAAIEPPGVVMAAIAANEDGAHEITFSPEAAGTAKVTVTAADPDGASASIRIDVVVDEEGMQAPEYVGDLPDSIALMPGYDETVDVEGAFVEHEEEELTITHEVRGDDPESVLITWAGTEITITARATSGSGNSIVAIIATDEDNKTAEHEITVSVRATLHPKPSDMMPPSVSLDVGGVPRVIEDVSVYFVDPNVGELTYTATSSDETKVTAVAVGVMVTITPVAATESPVTVTVTADNGSGKPATQTISVTVNPTPPTRNGEIADQELMIGQSEVILLDQYFTPGARSDHDDLTYSVASGDSDKVTAAVARGSEALTITGVASGMATVTVTATDNHGETETQEFDVTVTEEVAQAPLPTHTDEVLQDRGIPSDGGPQTIDLNDHFSDATGYIATSSEESVLTVSVADGVLTLTPVSSGQATVTVTPSNNTGNGPPQTFTVTVQAKPTAKEDMEFPTTLKIAAFNGPPDTPFTAATDATALIAAVKRYTLGDHITDPDGEDSSLKFSTTTTDAKIVAVYDTYPADTADATDDNAEGVNVVAESARTVAKLDKDMESTNAKVTLRGRKVGTATITIMATDADMQTQTWRIEVTVVAAANNAPEIDSSTVTFPGTGTTAATNTDGFHEFVRLADVGRFKSTDTMPKKLEMDLSDLFTDADVETNSRTTGDSWTFKAVSTNTDAVTVTLEDIGTRTEPDKHRVVITPVGSGDATIYFTATDSFEATAGGMMNASGEFDETANANTFFKVKVNNKPVPYSGEGDARRSLSTEDAHQGLVAGFTATAAAALVDDPATVPTPTDPMNEGYFSDKDGDALLCRLMSTTGESATITITDRDEYSVAGVAGKTGPSTFRIRCFDQVNGADFEWAEDTLTVTVPYLQSIR